MEVVAIIEKDLNATLKKLDLEYGNNWNKVSHHCKKYMIKCLKTTAKGAYYMHKKYIYIYESWNYEKPKKCSYFKG